MAVVREPVSRGPAEHASAERTSAERTSAERRSAERGSVVAGRYRLGQTLGRGGCGTVFEAIDLRTQETVALKLPTGASVPDPVRRSLAREAECGRRVGHRNIVRVLADGWHGGRPYLVLECLPGQSLRQRCGRPAPVDALLTVAGALASALAASHRAGVVHGDVKPDNVMLHGGRAVLIDFGLACVAGEGEAQDGTASGTPGYMSPEQARGLKQLPPESDVYSLGCLLHELATGRTPFLGTAGEQMWKHVHWTAPRLEDLSDRVFPTGLSTLMSHMLEKAPLDRPGAATVAARLADIARAWKRDRATQAPPPAPRAAGERQQRGETLPHASGTRTALALPSDHHRSAVPSAPSLARAALSQPFTAIAG